MDNVIIATIVLAGVQLIFLPWAVYVTRSINEQNKSIAVTDALNAHKDDQMQKLEDELKEIRQELKDMPMQIVKMININK